MAELRRTIPGFTRRDNTLSRVVRDVPERRIELEIGDATRPDFVPQTKTKWFDNEYNVSVRAKEHAEAVVSTRGNKVYYETPDYTVIQYETPAGEEGGHELEWELPSKPDSNILPFTLRYKGDVRFYHQPALTQEEIDEGAERPENVVDSYAVYVDKKNHRLGGNNYATGKVQHIYRPKAIDANGNETWCILHIPPNGQAETNIDCSVEVPQDFLDNAAYPVLVDPTFGHTTQGASEAFIATYRESPLLYQSTRSGNSETASATGAVDSMSAYLRTTNNSTIDVYFAINEMDSGGVSSHGEVALYSSPISLTTSASLETISFGSETITNAVDYVLNYAADAEDIPTGGGSSLRRVSGYFDNGVGSNNYYFEGFSGSGAFATSQEDPWTETASTNRLYSLYATYTVAYTLTADAGSFTFSGTAAALEAGRYLAANAGSYTLTGQDATFVVDRVLTAGSGSYTLTGTDATLSFSGTTYTLTADPGSYTLTGTDAALKVGRLITATPGSYTLTGQDATLTRDAVLSAASGSYTLTGAAATLTADRTLTAGSGSYTLAGTDASLVADRVMIAASGSFALTGTDASLNYVTGYLLTAESGSFTLTGSDITLTRSTRIFYNLDTGKLMYKVTGTYLIDL